MRAAVFSGPEADDHRRLPAKPAGENHKPKRGKPTSRSCMRRTASFDCARKPETVRDRLFGQSRSSHVPRTYTRHRGGELSPPPRKFRPRRRFVATGVGALIASSLPQL